MKATYTIKRHSMLSSFDIDLPTGVQDMTLGQFLRLKALPGNDTLEMLSILSEQPREKFEVLTYGEIQRVEALLATPELSASIAEYMNDANALNRLEPPKTVSIGGKEIKIAPDLLNSAYYATRKAIEIIKECEEDKTEVTMRYHELIAHFLYCPFTEMKYNEDRAEEFAEVIKDLSMTDGIQLGNFILRKLSPYWMTKVQRLALTSTMTRSRLTRTRSKVSALYQRLIT